jgi:transposase
MRYNSEGAEALRHRRHTTSYRPTPTLLPTLQAEQRPVLAEAARRNDHWTRQDVVAWMAERLGRPVAYQLGWSYLVRLKHSLQAPRPRHARADAEQQDTFKKS